MPTCVEFFNMSRLGPAGLIVGACAALEMTHTTQLLIKGRTLLSPVTHGKNNTKTWTVLNMAKPLFYRYVRHALLCLEAGHGKVTSERRHWKRWIVSWGNTREMSGRCSEPETQTNNATCDPPVNGSRRIKTSRPSAVCIWDFTLLASKTSLVVKVQNHNPGSQRRQPIYDSVKSPT